MTRKLVATLPVFLPGNNRDWTKVDGVLNLTDDGEMAIRLRDNAHVGDLLAMAEANVLLQVSFDYRANDEALSRIHARHTAPKSPVQKSTTLRNACLALEEVGVSDPKGAVEAMQKAGIVFFEKEQ